MGGRRLQPRRCATCSDLFKPKYSEQKYCTLICSYADKALNQTSPVGSRRLTSSGHVQLVLADGRRVLEHRHNWEQAHGLKLESWQYIRHKDGDKTNNDPSNLALFPDSLEAYFRRTRKLLPRGVCPRCGQLKVGWRTSSRTGRKVRYCRRCDNSR